MKSIILSIACYFLHVSVTQAILFGDKESMDEARTATPQGSYIIRAYEQGFSNNSSEGCAVVFESKNGCLFGLTSAHALNPKENQSIGLLYRQRIDKVEGRTVTVKDHLCPNHFQKHPSYDPKAAWEEQVKFDIGIFSIERKYKEILPHKYSSNIYGEPLISGEKYEAIFCSHGASFDNGLTSFMGSTYHEAPITITYDAQGFFYQTVESRDFYFRLSKGENNTIEWFCDVLPNPGQTNSIKGDSGGLLRTLDGKALALNSGKSWQEFYTNNLGLAAQLKKLREMKFSMDDEAVLLQQIHELVADEQRTKKLVLEDGRILYRFTLQEHLPALKAVNYFTPLSIHKEFIDKFVKENKEQAHPID